MVFQSREQAARLLADRLVAYRGRCPLVLAIPRGAVPMAEIIAESLGGDLDVVLVHKLGAPGDPEFAIGSIDEHGHVYLNESAGPVPESWIARERSHQLAEIRRRRQVYSAAREPIDPAGRVLILVDDGVATGLTMRAALNAVRTSGAAEVIAAVAVAPPDALRRMREVADEVVCLHSPQAFGAVGFYFADFGQVSDDEVTRILRRRAEALA